MTLRKALRGLVIGLAVLVVLAALSPELVLGQAQAQSYRGAIFAKCKSVPAMMKILRGKQDKGVFVKIAKLSIVQQKIYLAAVLEGNPNPDGRLKGGGIIVAVAGQFAYILPIKDSHVCGFIVSSIQTHLQHMKTIVGIQV